LLEHDYKAAKREISYFYIFSSLYNQLVIFDIIVFPFAASCYFVIWVTKMHDYTMPLFVSFGGKNTSTIFLDSIAM